MSLRCESGIVQPGGSISCYMRDFTSCMLFTMSTFMKVSTRITYREGKHWSMKLMLRSRNFFTVKIVSQFNRIVAKCMVGRRDMNTKGYGTFRYVTVCKKRFNYNNSKQNETFLFFYLSFANATLPDQNIYIVLT